MTEPSYVWEDSYSDGMCGYVVIRDTKTGRKARVHWSVTGEFTSQSAAAEEARRQLKEHEQ